MAAERVKRSQNDKLDFLSSRFHPLRALYTLELQPPVPNIQIFNNLAEYARVIKEGKSKPRPKPTAAGNSTDFTKLLPSRTKNLKPEEKKKTEARMNVVQEKLKLMAEVGLLRSAQNAGLLDARRSARFEELRKKAEELVREDQEKQTKKKRANVLDKMEACQDGPFSVLYTCLKERRRVKVWTRRVKGLRGVLAGYLVAFDKHMNMALTDVDEVYTVEERLPKDENKAKEKAKRKKKRWKNKALKNSANVNQSLSEHPTCSTFEEPDDQQVRAEPGTEICSRARSRDERSDVESRVDEISEESREEKSSGGQSLLNTGNAGIDSVKGKKDLHEQEIEESAESERDGQSEKQPRDNTRSGIGLVKDVLSSEPIPDSKEVGDRESRDSSDIGRVEPGGDIFNGEQSRKSSNVEMGAGENLTELCDCRNVGRVRIDVETKDDGMSRDNKGNKGAESGKDAGRGEKSCDHRCSESAGRREDQERDQHVRDVRCSEMLELGEDFTVVSDDSHNGGTEGSMASAKQSPDQEEGRIALTPETNEYENLLMADALAISSDVLMQKPVIRGSGLEFSERSRIKAECVVGKPAVDETERLIPSDKVVSTEDEAVGEKLWHEKRPRKMQTTEDQAATHKPGEEEASTETVAFWQGEQEEEANSEDEASAKQKRNYSVGKEPMGGREATSVNSRGNSKEEEGRKKEEEIMNANPTDRAEEKTERRTNKVCEEEGVRSFAGAAADFASLEREEGEVLSSEDEAGNVKSSTREEGGSDGATERKSFDRKEKGDTASDEHKPVKSKSCPEDKEEGELSSSDSDEGLVSRSAGATDKRWKKDSRWGPGTSAIAAGEGGKSGSRVGDRKHAGIRRGSREQRGDTHGKVNKTQKGRDEKLEGRDSFRRDPDARDPDARMDKDLSQNKGTRQSRDESRRRSSQVKQSASNEDKNDTQHSALKTSRSHNASHEIRSNETPKGILASSKGSERTGSAKPNKVKPTRDLLSKSREQTGKTREHLSRSDSEASKTRYEARGAHGQTSRTREHLSRSDSEASKTRYEARGAHGQTSKTREHLSRSDSETSKTRYEARGAHGQTSKTREHLSRSDSEANKTRYEPRGARGQTSRSDGESRKIRDTASGTRDQSRTRGKVSQTGEETSKIRQQASRSCDKASKISDHGDRATTTREMAGSARDKGRVTCGQAGRSVGETRDKVGETHDEAKTRGRASRTGDKVNTTRNQPSRTFDSASDTRDELRARVTSARTAIRTRSLGDDKKEKRQTSGTRAEAQKRVASADGCGERSAKRPRLCTDKAIVEPKNLQNVSAAISAKSEQETADQGGPRQAMLTGRAKCLVFKRRHVNQLFVRGENVVIVAYTK